MELGNQGTLHSWVSNIRRKLLNPLKVIKIRALTFTRETGILMITKPGLNQAITDRIMEEISISRSMHLIMNQQMIFKCKLLQTRGREKRRMRS